MVYAAIQRPWMFTSEQRDRRFRPEKFKSSFYLSYTMGAILVTGMSGTGKSTLLKALESRGYRTIDTDYNGWCIPSPGASELIWDELKVSDLLSSIDNQRLVISGCVSNQRIFYNRLIAVVLLTAPTNVIVERILARDTNEFGKKPGELERILNDIVHVEPLLRMSASVELDGRTPVNELADTIGKLFDEAESNRR